MGVCGVGSPSAIRPLRTLGVWPDSGGNASVTCRLDGIRLERQLLTPANSHAQPLADVAKLQKQTLISMHLLGFTTSDVLTHERHFSLNVTPIVEFAPDTLISDIADHHTGFVPLGAKAFAHSAIVQRSGYQYEA